MALSFFFFIAPHDPSVMSGERVAVGGAKFAEKVMTRGEKDMATKEHLGKDDSAFALDVEGMVFWEE
jgi:hypothetical protein